MVCSRMAFDCLQGSNILIVAELAIINLGQQTNRGVWDWRRLNWQKYTTTIETLVRECPQLRHLKCKVNEGAPNLRIIDTILTQNHLGEPLPTSDQDPRILNLALKYHSDTDSDMGSDNSDYYDPEWLDDLKGQAKEWL